MGLEVYQNNFKDYKDNNKIKTTGFKFDIDEKSIFKALEMAYLKSATFREHVDNWMAGKDLPKETPQIPLGKSISYTIKAWLAQRMFLREKYI